MKKLLLIALIAIPTLTTTQAKATDNAGAVAGIMCLVSGAVVLTYLISHGTSVTDAAPIFGCSLASLVMGFGIYQLARSQGFIIEITNSEDKFSLDAWLKSLHLRKSHV